jgi:hypothetical protein
MRAAQVSRRTRVRLWATGDVRRGNRIRQCGTIDAEFYAFVAWLSERPEPTDPDDAAGRERRGHTVHGGGQMPANRKRSTFAEQ